MKNLHILPTDKPSRLYIQQKYNQLILGAENINTTQCKNQNIYITSEEEIKEGDFFIMNGYVIRKCDYVYGFMIIDTTQGKHHFSVCKKIILTTDQDLIKDGVQAINDEFLEWFVKNPNCEEVEVSYDKDAFPYGVKTAKGYGWYKIIIPKEEPKQVCENCKIEISKWGCGCGKQVKPKQETLEEAALKYTESTPDNDPVRITSFIKGAKWQQEQDKNKYSDLELFINEVKDKIDSFEYSVNQQSYLSEYITDWFEQFKKK